MHGLTSDLSWSDLEQRIPQTFQDGVGFQNLLLDPRVFAWYCCQVLQDEFGGLRLPGTGLPGDDNALVLASSAHQGVTVVSDGENMRGQLSNLFLLVQLDLLSCIDRQNLKRYIHLQVSSSLNKAHLDIIKNPFVYVCDQKDTVFKFVSLRSGVVWQQR